MLRLQIGSLAGQLWERSQHKSKRHVSKVFVKDLDLQLAQRFHIHCQGLDVLRARSSAIAFERANDFFLIKNNAHNAALRNVLASPSTSDRQTVTIGIAL